jgi:hypothetical protein
MFRTPKRPIQKTSAEFSVPPTSVLTALQLKLHHPHILQALCDDDLECRLELGE